MQDTKAVRAVEGIVQEALPGAMFRVKLPDNTLALGHLSGKMKMYHIKIALGDRVLIEFTPYDKTRGRISRRL
jgi:translation initiation factor IF-1